MRSYQVTLRIVPKRSAVQPGILRLGKLSLREIRGHCIDVEPSSGLITIRKQCNADNEDSLQVNRIIRKILMLLIVR